MISVMFYIKLNSCLKLRISLSNRYKYDCIKSLAISDKTLTKALTKNIPYNGHYYKEIGAKLKMI